MRKQNTKMSRVKNISVMFGLVLAASLTSSTPALAACPAQYDGYGKLTGSFDIKTPGTYTVWSRIQPKSAGKDSFVLEIDGTTCGVVVGDNAALAANQWTWVDYRDATPTSKIKPTLTAGTHSYVIYGREDNVGVDKILFIADGCVPANTGTNCPAPAGTPTGGGTTTTPPTSGGSTTGGSTSSTGSSANGATTAASSPVAILTNPVSAATNAAKNIQTPAEAVSTVADIVTGNKPISTITQIVTGNNDASSPSVTRLSPALVKAINISGFTFVGAGIATTAYFFVQQRRHKLAFAFMHGFGGNHMTAAGGVSSPQYIPNVIKPTITLPGNK
jgi:hypothetical protein